MSKKNQKDSKGKSKLHLIPSEALYTMCDAYEFGEIKYNRFGFRDQPIEYTKLTDAAIRHILKFLNGDYLDSESGKSHIGHAMANLGMLEYTIQNHPKMDDRHKKVKKK